MGTGKTHAYGAYCCISTPIEIDIPRWHKNVQVLSI